MKTERLISVFAEVLQTADGHQDDDAALGRGVKDLLDARVGANVLLDDCASISTYSVNNYPPLLWQFYKSHRSVWSVCWTSTPLQPFVYVNLSCVLPL